MQEQVVVPLRNELKEEKQNLESCIRKASDSFVMMMMWMMMMKLRWEEYMK